MKKELYDRVLILVGGIDSVNDIIGTLRSQGLNGSADCCQLMFDLLNDIKNEEKPELSWDKIKVGQWFKQLASRPLSQYVKINKNFCWHFYDGQFKRLVSVSAIQFGLVLIDPVITEEMQKELELADITAKALDVISNND